MLPWYNDKRTEQDLNEVHGIEGQIHERDQNREK